MMTNLLATDSVFSDISRRVRESSTLTRPGQPIEYAARLLDLLPFDPAPSP